MATQGTPRRVTQLDGWQLKALHKQLGRHAARLLNLSRLLTAGAALVVLAAMAVAWLANGLHEQLPALRSVLVVRRSSQVQCGQLVGGAAPTLKVRGSHATVRLQDVAHLVPVDTCPP